MDWNTNDLEFENKKKIDINMPFEESGITVESINLKDGIATGNEALRILDNPETRNDFIDQLLEVSLTTHFINFVKRYDCCSVK